MIQNSLNYAIKSKEPTRQSSNFKTSPKINNWRSFDAKIIGIDVHCELSWRKAAFVPVVMTAGDYKTISVRFACQTLIGSCTGDLDSFSATFPVIIAECMAVEPALNLKALETLLQQTNTSLTIRTFWRANSSAKFHMKFSGITSDGASCGGNLLFANRKMSRKLSRVGRAHRELLNYLWPKTLRQLSQPLMTRRSCEKSFKSARRPSAVLPRPPRIWFIINLIAKNTSRRTPWRAEWIEIHSRHLTMWRWCTIHVCVINESSWISLPAPASFMRKLWTAMKFKFIHQTFNNYVPVLLLLGLTSPQTSSSPDALDERYDESTSKFKSSTQ